MRAKGEEDICMYNLYDFFYKKLYNKMLPPIAELYEYNSRTFLTKTKNGGFS